MTMNENLHSLVEAGIVAVLRGPSREATVRTVEALVKGGITGIEVTYSTPDAAAVIADLREIFGPQVYLGAGTIRTAEQAREAVDAGASFLVSPGNMPDVSAAMVSTGAHVLIGALSPTEVMAAAAAGAHAVKVFPASLGGPSYLKALKGPLPDIPLMPTGGVNAGNLDQWFAAGAVAVGAGGDLCPAAAMANGDWALIEETAKQFKAALDAVRHGQ